MARFGIAHVAGVPPCLSVRIVFDVYDVLAPAYTLTAAEVERSVVGLLPLPVDISIAPSDYRKILGEKSKQWRILQAQRKIDQKQPDRGGEDEVA